MQKSKLGFRVKVTREHEMVNSITASMDMDLSKLWETVEDRRTWWATVHRVARSRTRLSD